MNIDNEFASWLQSKHDYSSKSAGDVLSRLKRAIQYIDIKPSTSIDRTLFELGQNRDFLKMTTSVKSQLRRAIKLYKEFQNK